MPKNCYKTFYYYLVKEYDDDNHSNLIQKRRFKTATEISNNYNISRCNVFHKISGNTPVKKLKNLVFMKEKVPVFQSVEIEY